MNLKILARTGHTRLRLLQTVTRSLGFRATLLYIAKERALRLLGLLPGYRGAAHAYRLLTPLSRYPLECRFGTSDREVFKQVFIAKSYQHARQLENVHTIVDCGANVGYASAFFLTLFPDARLVAIEPDPANYAVLRRNLKLFGSRALTVQAAIWSHETRLSLERGKYRDGRAWTTRVIEGPDGENPDVRGIDLGSLMAESGIEIIDLLKVDIEGAESMMFLDATAWMGKVGAIMIELHEAPAKTIFAKAIKDAGGFTLSTDGELDIARRTLVTKRRNSISDVQA